MEECKQNIDLILDQLLVMNKQEHKYLVKEMKLLCDNEKIKQIILYYIRFVEHFHLSCETVPTALNILSRYFEKNSHEHNEECKYIVPASLYLAAKIRNKIRFVNKTPQILSMERKLLSVFNWRVNPPTAFAFVANFASLMIGLNVLHSEKDSPITEAYAVVNLSLLDPFFITCKPSSIAFASLLIGFTSLDMKWRVIFNEKLFDLLNNIALAIGIDIKAKQLMTILQKQLEYKIYEDQMKNTALSFAIDSYELAKILQKLIHLYQNKNNQAHSNMKSSDTCRSPVGLYQIDHINKKRKIMKEEY